LGVWDTQNNHFFLRKSLKNNYLRFLMKKSVENRKNAPGFDFGG